MIGAIALRMVGYSEAPGMPISKQVSKHLDSGYPDKPGFRNALFRDGDALGHHMVFTLKAYHVDPILQIEEVHINGS